jgi:NitT/TauT family transport system substrate-binding protein
MTISRSRFLRTAAGGALLAGASAVLRAPSVRAQAPRAITYMFAGPPTLPAFAPHMIAKHKGYFAAEGLEPRFVTGQGGADVATQVGAGNAEAGGGIGDTTIVVRPNGVPVRAVALLGGGGLHQLFIREDAGITDPRQLRGKVIAVQAFQDTSYYALLGTLAALGLTRNDVTVQAAGPAGIVQLLVNGTAQAMVGVFDFALAAEAGGVRLRRFSIRDYFPSMAQTVLVSDSSVAQRPDLVRAIVRPLLKALGEIVADPNAAIDAYLAAVPENAGRREQMAAAIRAYAQYVYAGQARIGAFNPDELRTLQEFYLREGIIRRATPLDELYTNQFVAA